MSHKETFTHWTTYSGEVKEISTIDHQHLSNIIYFMTYVNPKFYNVDILNRMTSELKDRFDNVLLPWRPKKEFHLEIKYLYDKGFLRDKEDKAGFDIVINDKVIGEIIL